MTSGRVERRLVAILAADIAGVSWLFVSTAHSDVPRSLRARPTACTTAASVTACGGRSTIQNIAGVCTTRLALAAVESAKLGHSRMRPPAVDEGLKTGALPRGAAVVVGARHPAHARVVSAEFGERRRAGNGIRHVIVAALGMRDGVPANRACAPLKPNDLALKAIIARQDDAAPVQKR